MSSSEDEVPLNQLKGSTKPKKRAVVDSDDDAEFDFDDEVCALLLSESPLLSFAALRPQGSRLTVLVCGLLASVGRPSAQMHTSISANMFLSETGGFGDPAG